MHKLIQVIPPEEIQKRVWELAKEISDRYAGEPLLMICVLKGAFLFFADLVKHMHIDPEVDFLRLSSYKQQTSRTTTMEMLSDICANVADKNVLIVDDIVDTGHSMQYLKSVLAERGPRSIAVCSLLNKRERRERDVLVDFCGFTLEKGFVVGYGLDYAEQYRHLGGIFELVP
ncbi:MAG: hypoxanthine phosphoribosyltransferase [Desulfovibrionales bacterium]